MKYYILGSGSGGNSTALVNDKNEILLIDCGLPIIEIKRRLNEVGLDFDNVKKVLITHMHVDHVKSIKAFDPQNIYLNVLTEMNSSNLFDYYEEFELLGFHIYTLPASHDSPGTTGFLIQYNNEKMAYITDTGYIHENTQKIINNCDIYCIESNHDPRLLMLTKRPMFLKNRILSSSGHLSNQDCSYVLGNVIGPKTKQIVFLHRSQEANSEDMVNQTFVSTMNKMGVNISNIDTKIARANEVVVLENIKV
jgi:phosphoribosyl 1,2-cyclic phosphodiesterase